MSTKIGDIIKLTYTGRLEDGTIFDTTDETVAKENGIHQEGRPYGPLAVVIGSGFLVQGFEEDITGKKAGYKGSVTVQPEVGFGLRRVELVETIPEKKFGFEVKPGDAVEVEGRMGVVQSMSGGRVKVDFNDPLAGQVIVYEYKIEDVIEDKNTKIGEIIKQYVGKDAKYKVDKDMVTIEVPKGLYLDDNWLIGKFIVSKFLIRFVDVKKVTLIETIDENDFKEEI
ncbi:peptidylprolyl isomerase [Methanocella sp. CWC-04]|uniref:Peptidyl-prolyl cis-trans isomerase n=1 Tax=Methanooceanicella nereidis TaxID=2052831 RepID=A0AAP2W474_9EURY|nr:peptidylprolyl isomerase [Methanocella sp. CWC-04]MCD1293925.1 peptidylprolyl isomerase [Methanocella sp. CWC-04]